MDTVNSTGLITTSELRVELARLAVAESGLGRY
jgi:hypothetical protein